MQKKINELMEKEQITFADLAKQLNVSKQTLTKKMVGSLDFTYDEIIILTKIFHIDDPIQFFF